MTKSTKQSSFFECILCSYKCSKPNEFTKHLSTAKHEKMASLNTNITILKEKVAFLNDKITTPSIILPEKRIYKCINCKKTYKAANGLWYHSKKCQPKQNIQIELQENKLKNEFKQYDYNIDLFSDKCEYIISENNKSTYDYNTDCDDNNNNNNNNNNNEIIAELIKQNQEFKEIIIQQNKSFKEFFIDQKELFVDQNEMFIEQTKEFKELFLEQNNKLIELVSEPKTINTNNNNTNNFNINMFLNETCKDAMNISDFIKNIEVEMHELENIGRNGYVSGMTDIFLSRLKLLDVTKRPLHCSDLKREVMYFHEKNQWNKDNANHDILRKLFKCITAHNLGQMEKWQELNPNGDNSSHSLYDFRINMLQNIWGNVGEIHNKLNNKIIKNLAQQVYIDKTS